MLQGSMYGGAPVMSQKGSFVGYLLIQVERIWTFRCLLGIPIVCIILPHIRAMTYENMGEVGY